MRRCWGKRATTSGQARKGDGREDGTRENGIGERAVVGGEEGDRGWEDDRAGRKGQRGRMG